MPLTVFQSGNTAASAEVNANFALCVLTDTARTIAVTHTWSASQDFDGGFTADGATFTDTVQASTLLRFAGATSSFPAWKRSSTTLICRLADDSGDASLQAKQLSLTFGGQTLVMSDGTQGATWSITSGSVNLDATGSAVKLQITGLALNIPASSTTRASLNIPHGSAPTAPVNGDIWTTTAGLFVRINGSTVGPLS